MPITSEDWMKVLSHVSDAEELKANIKGSFFGSISIAFIAMICSVILGPIGLLLGGIGGSIYVYTKMRGSFKPLSSIIKGLSKEQQQALFADISDIRSQITAQDYVELILLLQGGSYLVLKRQLLEILTGFIKSNFSADVIGKK